eukprot:11594677-Prorocentrum_lima.AAC.1
MLSDWAGHELRRYTEDMTLEICLRLKGGNPEPTGPASLDDKLVYYMAAIQLIRKWAEDRTQ